MTSLDMNTAPAPTTAPANVRAAVPTTVPTTASAARANSAQPASPGARLPYHGQEFRRIKGFIGGHLTVSVLTLGVAAALSGRTSAVDAAVWIRATLVAVGAVVLYVCAARAARGSRGAYRRLRILSAVTLAAIVAVVALPGTFPLWLKAEQAGCGLLMAAVVVLANNRALRALFAAPAAAAARS